ncbi:hypothetical protein [uncultured Acetobacteroides sp.]|uniref:hypothetical protein n=1 Tax=uncultured Acetobacteroides sp. TaxID=1760811 RepID=UPI0029F4B19D|nr:hypothetical protein [uncultured Acetobacteroides sp.]
MGKTISGITQNSKELKSLLEEVCSKNGWLAPVTGSDRKDLVAKIQERLIELYPDFKVRPSIQESTLSRLFCNEKYAHSFGMAETLNPLARMADHESWVYYVEKKKRETQHTSYPNFNAVNPTEEETFYAVDLFDDAERLPVGSILRMGWYPHRYADLEYMGDCEFKVVRYAGATPEMLGRVVTGRWFEVVDIKPNPNQRDAKQDIAAVLGDAEYEFLGL